MAEGTEQLRAQVEATRERLGQDVGALSYKTDVKARAGDKVQSVKDRITGAVSDVTGSGPDSGDAKAAARRGAGMARDNPLGLAVGAAAAGFLVGLLFPSTKIEDEKVGPLADDLKDKVKETGQEALERGKQVAADAADTAKDSAQHHGEQLRDSAQRSADEVRGSRTS